MNGFPNTEQMLDVDSTAGLRVGDVIRVRTTNPTTQTYWFIYSVVQTVTEATSLLVAVMWVEDSGQSYV